MQAATEDDAALLVNVGTAIPAGQAEQRVELAAAKEVATHRVQPQALAVPPLLTTPAYPAAQMVNTAAEVPPVPGDEMPVGQAMQDAAPAAPTYVPAAQAVQLAAPAAE